MNESKTIYELESIGPSEAKTLRIYRDRLEHYAEALRSEVSKAKRWASKE